MYSSQQRPPARPPTLWGYVVIGRDMRCSRPPGPSASGACHYRSVIAGSWAAVMTTTGHPSSRVPVAAISSGWVGGNGGGLHLLQLTWMLRMFMYVLILIMSYFIWEPCEAVGDHHNATCLALWLACLLHFCTASTGVDWALSVYSFASGRSCTSCRIDCKCLS